MHRLVDAETEWTIPLAAYPTFLSATELILYNPAGALLSTSGLQWLLQGRLFYLLWTGQLLKS